MIRSCPVKPNATDCNLRSFLAIPTATHPLILADNSIRTQTRWESHRKSHRQTCAYQRTIHPDLFTLACRLLLRICCGCLPAVSATRPRLGKYGGLGPNFSKCPGEQGEGTGRWRGSSWAVAAGRWGGLLQPFGRFPSGVGDGGLPRGFLPVRPVEGLAWGCPTLAMCCVGQDTWLQGLTRGKCL